MNNTNHPALEAVPGQAVGRVSCLRKSLWELGRGGSLLGSGMSKKGKKATWVREDNELEPCDKNG